MEPLAVILGAIVGGAAAILAPVIQRAWFRRDDQKRDHEQRRARRDELFFTHRLEVFARYMQTLSRTYEGLKALRHVTRVDGDVGGTKLQVQQHIDELYTIETDIRLLAPEVVSKCSVAIEAARMLRDADQTDDVEVRRLTAELKQARIEIEQAFSRQLGSLEQSQQKISAGRI